MQRAVESIPAGSAPALPARIRRFTALRLVEHWLCAIVVLLLAVTGLCQKFSANEFCQWVVAALGGIETTRLLHRIGGSLLTLLVLQHVAIAAIGIGTWKWMPHMMISRKDVTDAIRNLKYYIGVTDNPALCDRYCYNQKFEYWAILTGLMLMVVTGFVLWYPTDVTRFLPGQVIPAAKALHTNEALLIFLLIAVWHAYNALFSPDVFPLDTSIFTGYMSLERMEREHPLELERLRSAQSGDADAGPPGKGSGD